MRINLVRMNSVQGLYIVQQVSMSEKRGEGIGSLMKLFSSCLSRVMLLGSF